MALLVAGGVEDGVADSDGKEVVWNAKPSVAVLLALALGLTRGLAEALITLTGFTSALVEDDFFTRADALIVSVLDRDAAIDAALVVPALRDGDNDDEMVLERLRLTDTLAAGVAVAMGLLVRDAVDAQVAVYANGAGPQNMLPVRS